MFVETILLTALFVTFCAMLLVGFHIAGAVAVWIMTLRLYLAFRLPIEPNTKQVTP